MAKEKGSQGLSPDQEIENKVLEFLRETSVSVLTATHPIDSRKMTAWNFYINEWKEGDDERQQTIVMIDEIAQRFFRLTDTVFALYTKRKLNKGDIPISEKNVATVLEQCVARYVWHNVHKGIHGAEQTVKTVLAKALLSQPKLHVVLVPVHGLSTRDLVEFRGCRYSRPAECPEYVERMSKILDGTELGIADAGSEELNNGFHVIVRVECEARFINDAIHGAKERVSRDLAILRYSAYREFQGPPHLASPGVINWERHSPTLSTIAFDDRNQGVIQIAAFSVGVAAPLNLQVWSKSKWSGALAVAHDISIKSEKSVASSLLDSLTWLGRSTVQEDDATRLLFQITALESLLPLDGKDEKTHQVSLQTTVLGGMAGSSRRDTYELIKRAYGVRSAVVHGSRMTTSKYEPDRIQRLLDRIVDFLLFNEEGKEMLSLSGDAFRLKLMEKLFER